MCEFLSGQFVKSSTYKYNYFYDGSANPSAYRLKKGQQIANIYTAKKGTKKKKETLKAVNVVTMNPNVKYSIQIYKNPKKGKPTSGKKLLKRAMTGTIKEAGTHTIDPVRFIGNRSSGKMGIALAGEAARRGAVVTLVLGPTSLDVPRGVECVRVQTAAEMLQAALGAFQTADAAICAAAVADYTPAAPADHKLKKANERLDRIELVETVDILAELSRQKGERRVIGFAAETDNVVEYAERKLARKGCDAIIANDVSRADSGFGSDTNKAWIVSTAGTQELPVLTKPQLADTILDLLKNN